MRFLALGDSFTIGTGVGPRERWPTQLVALLRDQGAQVDDPLIIAVRGWRTEHLMAGIDQAELPERFDLVSLLIGVNDQYDEHNLPRFRRQFPELPERAIGFAGNEPSRVLVLSIPDWSVTPFAEGRDRAAIAAEIDAFNAVVREEATRLGVHYVDVTPSSRAAATERSLIADDGLHPSGKMYAEWARLALPVARKALERQSVSR